ncbi:uncharacterized protein [Chelonus insularis]|uniref:uncharacterized protein n=1 Tax=Chelonus insularis TaxID=460826 RepID=UPI00158E2219|nr:uncharacterized protein LOC118064107 [Chelonus insularis]
MIASITITFLFFASIQARVITNTSCQITITYKNGDLKEPQPLILSKNKEDTIFLYPKDKSGILTISSGEKIYLACPGKYNQLQGVEGLTAVKEVEATCLKEKTFIINSTQFNFTTATCKYLPEHEAQRRPVKCYGDNTYIEIGFQLEKEFLRTIEICRNDATLSTDYTKFRLTHKIGNMQSNYPRPRKWVTGDFYNRINVDYYYKATTQLNMMKKITGSEELADKYIQAGRRFLSRGHMTARSDFVYGNAQRSTFWYLNAAPQWQTFNAGNWNTLEDSIRRFAQKKLLNLDVYTGVHGQMNITDVNNNQIPLYLFVNKTQQNLPVPRFFWKVIYDPLEEIGTAFVGVNDPYASNITDDMYMCQDISKSIRWLRWDPNSITKGISYACAIDDLRKNVPSIPKLKVHGVLK